jgi:3-oxoadipate enol-lactonase
MTFFTTNNQTKLHFVESGNPEGKLVIYLYGLGGSVETFTPLLPFLENTYRVIRLDFEGLGKSPLTYQNKPLSIARYSSDLGYLVSHVQRDGQIISPVIIIGHSLGSIIALHFAASNPSVVGGLVLLGVGRSTSHIAAVRERMLGMASQMRKQGIDYAAHIASTTNFPPDSTRQVDPTARDFIHRQVAGSDVEGYAKTCEAVADLNHKDPDYSRIKCGSLLIAGDVDMISPVSRAKDLLPLLGGKGQLAIVKSGHQPILEDLTRVESALGPFLAGLT